MLSGINVTCFAYGMTGAGKTHTMFGDIYHHDTGEDGICTMAIDAIFSRLAAVPNARFKLRTSYLEIYNEQVKDLLVAHTEQKVTRASTIGGGLMIVEDPIVGVTVPDLSEHDVKNSKELLELVLKGNEARTMAATKANQFSSRSHAILQIAVELHRSETGGRERVTVSKLSLVDLAGSERAATTENRGLRMLEGGKINRSLLALGNCINILSDRNRAGSSFVPYRDSKLTRLLKDSLGGNTKTVMIACASQAVPCYEETVNTLKYAERAKKIEKKLCCNVKEVEVNVDQYKEIIKELQEEIASLKGRLTLFKPTEGVAAPISMLTQPATNCVAPVPGPEKPLGDIDGAESRCDIEAIDAEIARTRECKEKFQEELIKCKEGNVQDMEFYSSVAAEDDGYLNKLSCDLLTKYEEHYEMKESIQELTDLNAKNNKALEDFNRELDDLVKRKIERTERGIELAIERKLSEIETLKKSIENNTLVQQELERSLDENGQMQQRYLALVIKLQSHKKKEILELQIATRELRLEKLDLTLQNLEMQKRGKIAESQRVQGHQEVSRMVAELARAKEELRTKDQLLQVSRDQISRQNKELEQLRKIKTMYSDAMRRSNMGELVSPEKDDRQAERTRPPQVLSSLDDADENLDDVAGLIGDDCLVRQPAEAENEYRALGNGRLGDDPSFASVSTVNYNLHEASSSALDSINLCVNAMSAAKNALGCETNIAGLEEVGSATDRGAGSKRPFAELHNCSPFAIPEVAQDAEQTVKHADHSADVPFKRGANTSREDKRRFSTLRLATRRPRVDKENVQRPHHYSSRQPDVFLVSELNDTNSAKRRNASARPKREAGFFSSVSEHYGKAMNNLQVRHSISTHVLQENANAPAQMKAPQETRKIGSFTSRYSVQPAQCALELGKIRAERNRMAKRGTRLNTTTGKMQSCLQISGCEAPTLMSLPAEKSLVSLNKEINDLIQRQKESLKVDFEKAKESALQRGIGSNSNNLTPPSYLVKQVCSSSSGSSCCVIQNASQ